MQGSLWHWRWIKTGIECDGDVDTLAGRVGGGNHRQPIDRRVTLVGSR